jgi:hypothetical protein
MVRRWGDDQADLVSQRLQELDGAECLGDLAELPYVAVVADGANPMIEIRDTEEAVVVICHAPEQSSRSAVISWRDLTSLIISDVIASGVDHQGVPD